MNRCMNCMEIYDEEYDICPYCGFEKGTPPEVISHLVPGTVIAGRYIIGTVISHGGFGVIYRAWDNSLGIKIAIKEYYPNGLVNRVPGKPDVIALGGDKKQQYIMGLKRFLQEARIMAKFNQEPNIPYVYTFLEENNTAYIVMELLEGIDLKHYVLQFPGQKMPIEDAISVVSEAGRALAAIHKDKIIHRDVSPDNIFLCEDGRIKLLDLGAARLSTGEKTQTLSVVLKPGYAPPEQYRSKSRQGPRTDVYALAATLYKLVTGVLPVESLDRMVEDTLESPSNINPEVPEWLDSVIMTGMAKNAEVRFASAEKFIEALNHEKTVSLPEQRIKRRRWVRAASVITVALAIAITSYAYFGMYSNISGDGVPNGQVTMWVPVSTDEDENRYREFDSAFEKKFKGKTVEITYIDKNDYQDKILSALEKGKAPDVFVGEYIDDITEKEALNSVLNDIPLRHIYLIKGNEKYIKENRQLPMGFTMQVLYENTYMSHNAQKSFVEDDGAEISKEPQNSDLFDSKYTKTGYKYFDEIAYSNEAQKEFIDEKITFYVGDVSEKSKIQKSLSGYSEVTSITNNGVGYGEFKNSLSIWSSADNKQKKIAKLLIKYGLSEEGQNILCVRNQGMLPLNKKTFDTFVDINSSLDFINPKEIEILNQ